MTVISTAVLDAEIAEIVEEQIAADVLYFFPDAEHLKDGWHCAGGQLRFPDEAVTGFGRRRFLSRMKSNLAIFGI